MPFLEKSEIQDRERCAEYIFGRLLNEPWATTESSVPDDFWLNTIKFLRKKGYKLVNKAQEKDVVGYAFKDIYKTIPDEDVFLPQALHTKRVSPFFEHFGIVKNGKVISKFAEGYVYEHDLDTIPDRFGELVFYFRKS